MAFTEITVTQDFTLADGTDPSGTVTFTPTSAMRNGDVTIPAVPVVAQLDGTGQMFMLTFLRRPRHAAK